MPDYTTTIEVKVHAHYTDTREAWTDAHSIATHIREECGNIVDDVRVADVEETGDSGQ